MPVKNPSASGAGTFLGAEKGLVGAIGGGKIKPTGRIDIAVMQSLSRHGEVDPMVDKPPHVGDGADVAQFKRQFEVAPREGVSFSCRVTAGKPALQQLSDKQHVAMSRHLSRGA